MLEKPSPNQDDRLPHGRAVDMLVLHYTGMRSAAAALERLCDPASGVSAHYVVDEDGAVYRLVPEERRAWHAGVSHWRGANDSNARSIGIEIVNPGHEFGYRNFPALQMAAVCDLCLAILARHPIPARNVVAHSDIAPARKTDPGELFDWRGLAQNGVGLWPAETGGVPISDHPQTVRRVLTRIGYDPAVDLPVVLRAFQRHWLAENLTGLADAPTRARLAEVAAAVERA